MLWCYVAGNLNREKFLNCVFLHTYISWLFFFIDTSRPQRADEVNGQDYHFITRQQFEQDILARRFVEHGEYEKSYYGTSIEAIRSVVHLEKICVLNLHPQSLKILKNSDLMPYVVFVGMYI